MVGTTRGVSANTRDVMSKTRDEINDTWCFSTLVELSPMRRRETREYPFGRLRDLITKRRVRFIKLMA
jgi:hypothetical protein